MDILNDLNKKLNQTNISDYEILELSIDSTLIIIGSLDFSYYHEVEIYFYDTSYISCPKSFTDATFRMATKEEIDILRKDKLFSNSIDGAVICIELDKHFDEPREKHYIIASDISYNFEMVYYFKKEDIKEGERIADWVK